MKDNRVHPLRQERLRKGWTQRQLADFAQVALSSVERAERWEPLRVDICQRLCQTLGKERPEELGLRSHGELEERSKSHKLTHLHQETPVALNTQIIRLPNEALSSPPDSSLLPPSFLSDEDVLDQL